MTREELERMWTHVRRRWLLPYWPLWFIGINAVVIALTR